MDVTSDIMSLHIGDTILEVNGTPVRDQPLENIENIIKYSDTVVQLTIEHDPEANTRLKHALPLTNLRVRIFLHGLSVDACFFFF